MHGCSKEGIVHPYSRSVKPSFKEEGGQSEEKNHILIRLTNFLITAHTMVGGKDARRRTLFCDIPFMKEQVSNQEKGAFYLNLKQGDL